MTEDNQNTENTEEKTVEKEEMFYDLVMKECAVEISALSLSLSRAMRDENTDAICKITESLARIKQNAMLTAANAQATLLRMISQGRNAKVSSPIEHEKVSSPIDPEAVAKKFIADTRNEVVKKQG